MNELLNQLNDMQRAAAEKVDGPLLVLAGAGSGKTRVLTYRIAHMIYEKNIAPWNILAITFTNKAAAEMARRVEALVGGAARDMWVRTFHSTCVRILRRDIDKIGYDRNFNIIDSDDQKSLVKECLKELRFGDKEFQPRSVLNEISSAKDKPMTAADYAAEYGDDYRKKQISRVYALYQTKLRNANDLDFDDLIMLTVQLFREQPEVLDFYRNKFRYILVDEYQDTNMAQNELVMLLAKEHRNLCVVGDDDQSIYKFRGADISNILDFEKAFPEAEVVRLEQNYRSTQNILDAANNVIKNNNGRKGKNLWTEHGSGGKITVYKAFSDSDEAGFIADTMRALSSEGYSYGDMAVLYRANSSSRSLEDMFMRRAIPYRVLVGLRFYDRKEIRDMIAYLRLIKNPSDDISLKRIINTPPRKIGKVTLDSIAAAAARDNTSMLDAIGRNTGMFNSSAAEFYGFIMKMRALSETEPIDELVNEVYELSGYRAFLENDEKADERMDNVGELISGAAHYCETAENASFSDYMDNLALISDIDNYNEELDAAVLMTIHAAKGLEFPIVFICGFDDGIFPNFMCMYDQGEMEEERRLCYVGITRAKEKLFLTCAKSRIVYGKSTQYRPSRFLEEIPEEVLDVIDPAPAALDIKIPPRFDGRKVPENSLLEDSQPHFAHKTAGSSFKAGDRVLHKKFGSGTVISATPVGNDIHYEIAFDSVGTKNLLGLYASLTKGE